MAGAPTAKVEVEFTAGVWTDVTAYWDAKRPITMTAGRSDTDEKVAPGRLSGLVLDNTDGRFTVGNASGAYYPNVTSGKKVRVSVKDPASSTYYNRFTGRIEGWPLHWEDNATTCWVTVSATDMLNDWAVATMPTEWIAYAMEDLGAVAYWPCTVKNQSGALPPGFGDAGPLVDAGNAPTTFNADGPPGDPRKLPEFAYNSAANSWYKGTAPALATNGWAISAWIKVTGEPPSTGYYPVVVEQVVTPAPGNRVTIRVKPDAVYASTISSGGIVTDRANSAVNICDNSWHLVRVKVTDNGGGLSTIAIMVDSANVSTGSVSTSTTLCNSTVSRTVAIGTTTGAAVGHVALWDASVSPTTQEVAESGAGLPIQSVTDRLALIGTLAGLTAPTVVGDARVIVTCSTPYGVALDLVRQVEDTDGGVLWCDGDGVVTYSASLSRTTTPALVLSLTPADIADVEVAADRVNVVNEATVTNTAPLNAYRPDPTEETVVLIDATSVAAMGKRPRSLSTVAVSYADGHIATRAAELLSLSEAPRIPSMTLDVMGMTDANQLAVLGMAVWDQVAITDLPTAGGYDTKWLGRVEGWSETVAVDGWSVTLNTSFAGNRLGDATHGLILGSNRLG